MILIKNSSNCSSNWGTSYMMECRGLKIISTIKYIFRREEKDFIIWDRIILFLGCNQLNFMMVLVEGDKILGSSMIRFRFLSKINRKKNSMLNLLSRNRRLRVRIFWEMKKKLNKSSIKLKLMMRKNMKI